MTSTVTAIDIALGVAILFTVALTVLQRSRKTQVMSFLGLGVILSLVWLRLGSLDVGLAEAALGSGILSAVLVLLAASPTSGQSQSTQWTRQRDKLPLWLSALVGVGSGAVLSFVIANVWLRVEHQLPLWEAELGSAMTHLPVEHGVTGVLLSFRAYDTLLESAVLMFAAILARALMPSDSFHAVSKMHRVFQGPAKALDFSWAFRIMVPLLMLLGLWLLFAGTTQPGGAFQSGAVLAGMLILIHLIGGPVQRLISSWLSALAIIGVVVFAVAAGIALLGNRAWFTWPDTGMYALILTVEVTLTIGIAVALFMLYLAVSYRSSGAQLTGTQEQEVTS